MFKNVSKAGVGVVGIIVFVVILLGQTFGVSIAEADATTFAQNVVGVVGFALTVWGQYSRKDLVGGLVRK